MKAMYLPTPTLYLPYFLQEDKSGENVTITPRSIDLVYIRSCSQCKFGVHGKSAKCIIGKLPTPSLVHQHSYII